MTTTPRNSIEDVHRSLREWVWRALEAARGEGERWKARLGDEIPLTDKERPVAYVELVAQARTLAARATAPQGSVERMAPFTVSAYPAVGATPTLSRQEADVIADVFGKLLDVGMAVAGAPQQPGHVPIFDWQTIPVDSTAPAAERALPNDALPYTWARVAEGGSVQTIKDPMDPKRYTVGVSLNLRWSAPGYDGLIGGESLGVEGAYVVP